MSRGKPNIVEHPKGEEEFITFYKSHYATLCFFANRFVNSSAFAHDIVSDTAIKIWQKRKSLTHIQSLKNYFYISIRNACLRHLESKKRLTPILAAINPPMHSYETMLDNIIRTETLAQIEAAISALPPACEKVFNKLYVEGKSIPETARELKLSKSTVKSQKQRGLTILRKKLLPPSTIIFILPFFVL